MPEPEHNDYGQARPDVVGAAVHYALPRLLQRKMLVLAFTLAAFLGALIYLHFAHPYYQAAAILSPGGSSPESGERNALSSLASLAGMSGGTEKLSPYDELQQVLGSNDLALHLSHNEDLLVLLFPGRRDAAHHAWIPRTGLRADAKALVYGWLNWPVTEGPDVAGIRAALSKRLTVTRDSKTNVMTITFRADSAQTAQRLLSQIIFESDQIVRAQFGNVATKFSNFILEKLKTVTSVDQRASLDSLLTEYQRLETLSQVSLPFTASIIDPPSAPDMPSGPSPVFILVGWVLVGLLLGVGFALLPDSLISPAGMKRMPHPPH